jgi:ubiquinone/menaquinone biosynthesis C-methylase UbiE
MNYSRVARLYQLIEAVTIGRPLLQARLAHLDALTQGPVIQHALLVGEGNGSFLLPFVRLFPDTQVTVIDESAEMLQLAQSRLQREGLDSARITFKLADMTTVRLPEGHYDLIVTLFFFDNFDEHAVRQMMTSLEGASARGARWLLADFQIPTNGWRRLRARIWLRMLYAFFGKFAGVSVRSLPATESLFAQTPFTLVVRETFSSELLYSSYFQRI